MGLVPLAKQGEPQGGGNYELWLHSWYKTPKGTRLEFVISEAFARLPSPPVSPSPAREV